MPASKDTSYPRLLSCCSRHGWRSYKRKPKKKGQGASASGIFSGLAYRLIFPSSWSKTSVSGPPNDCVRDLQSSFETEISLGLEQRVRGASLRHRPVGHPCYRRPIVCHRIRQKKPHALLHLGSRRQFRSAMSGSAG